MPVYLALPRLHRELVDALPAQILPAGSLTLWPGLPNPPAGVWAPAYPWTPAQAQACLADFSRLAGEGASGSPLLAAEADAQLSRQFSRMTRGADFSPAEARALAEFRARSVVGRPEQPPSAGSVLGDSAPEGVAARVAAQQTLLLAWLQEENTLELRKIERRVEGQKAALAGALRDGVPPEPAKDVEDEAALLPPWRAVLAAAAEFLPESGEVVLVPTEEDMAQALAQAHAAEAGISATGNAVGDTPGPALDDIPGFTLSRAPLWRLLGLSRPASYAGREVWFLYPADFSAGAASPTSGAKGEGNA